LRKPLQKTNMNLYVDGKVQKLLMSVDKPAEYHNPEVLRRSAVAMGIPAEDVVLDHATQRR
jgi:vancomycin permeability regulator SanA